MMNCTRRTKMGQNQSSCICEHEVIQPNDESTESRQPPQDQQKFAIPDEVTEVIVPKPIDVGSSGKIAITIVKDGDENNKRDDETLDALDLSELDPHISKVFRSKHAMVDKRKRRPWSPWRKRKEYNGFVTTGVTVRLNNNHNVVLYLPSTGEQKSNDVIKSRNERKTRKGAPNGIESMRDETFTDFHSAKTKLVIKDASEMKKFITMHTRVRKAHNIDVGLVCGVQIFVTRYNEKQIDTFNVQSSESAPTMRPVASRIGGFVPRRSLRGMNVLHPSILLDNKLQELLSVCKLKLFAKDDHNADTTRKKSADGNNKIVHRLNSQNVHDLSGRLRNNTHLSSMLSAIVPQGIGRELFIPERVLNSKLGPINDMICVDQTNDIYVCDTGLSPEQCDFIVDTTERCSRGNYASYTYAKQTLGCRDYDDLACLCEWPVIRTYASIMHHLEKKIKTENGMEKRVLVLDEREPHVVKYDTSKKERQKLDMHTDKSEWTFIIALSDGNGDDFYGGGTYMECMDATIHLQKGQALVFPGKRRHRGQKIIDGIRFLLVGFLVEKKDLDAKREAQLKKDAAMQQTLGFD